MRGQRVILDSDLAAMYGVPTKALLQAVKRNPLRFPSDFTYSITLQEVRVLRSQIVTSKKGRGGRRYLPYVFIEQGVAMLSSVLNSEKAILVNVAIMRAFVALRKMIAANKELSVKLRELERKIGKHDEEIQTIFHAIRRLMEPTQIKRRKIGFHSA